MRKYTSTAQNFKNMLQKKYYGLQFFMSQLEFQFRNYYWQLIYLFY